MLKTTNVREQEDLSLEIDVLNESEKDMRLLSLVNFLPNNLVATAEKHEWLDDQMPPESISLVASGGGADWDTNNDISGLPVAAAQIVKLKVGDILLMPLPATTLAEQVRVASIDLTANTIELTKRGWGGTTATAQGAVAFTAYIIGNAQEDGSDPMTENHYEATERYNYVQIFEDVLGISGKVMRSKISRESERARQRGIKLKRLLSQLNYAMLNGSREKSGEIATFQGLRNVATSTYNVNGSITVAKTYAMLTQMITAGGSPSAIHGSPTAIGRLEQLFAGYVTSGVSEYNAKLTVNKLHILSMEIELHVDKHMVDTEFLVLDYGRIRYGSQDSDQASGKFAAITITENGKQIKEQIVGYYVLEQRQAGASVVRAYGCTGV